MKPKSGELCRLDATPLDKLHTMCIHPVTKDTICAIHSAPASLTTFQCSPKPPDQAKRMSAGQTGNARLNRLAQTVSCWPTLPSKTP